MPGAAPTAALHNSRGIPVLRYEGPARIALHAGAVAHQHEALQLHLDTAGVP